MSLTDARRQHRKSRKFTKSLKKQLWKGLNQKSSTPSRWWIPKIPSILSMVWRCGMLAVLNVGVWAVEIIAIYGQNTFWSFAFVNTLYSDAATNQFDVGIFAIVVSWFLIWSIGMLWVLGFVDSWFD